MPVKLVLGDVVLFEADQSCLSRLICELSGSPVSHAAMYYDEKKHLIIEEGLNGVQTSPAPGGLDQKRTVYLRRFKKKGLPLTPVLKAAADHYAVKQPYSISNLVMIGVLLVSERFLAEKKYERAVMLALKIICSGIAKMISKKTHPGKVPMTCSQFVSQCFTDAGPKYNLKYDNKFLSSVEPAAGSLAAKASSRLRDSSLPPLQLEATVKEVAEFSLASINIHNELGKEMSVGAGAGDALEKLCCMLLELLKAPPQNKADEEPSDELLALSVYMTELLMEEDQPMATQIGKNDDTWKHLLELRNIFITPGDLLSHCEDLVEAGIIPPHQK